MRERRQPRERRVRQRLLAALLVCAVTVLAAAAPGVALAVRDLSRAQDRADAAQLTTRATVLAHSLADERDDLAAFAADGRDAANGDGLPEDSRSRVDRQVQDVAADAPAGLRTALAALPRVRQGALGGDGGPQSVISAYQPLLDALGRTAGPVTAPLTRAVTAAAVQRGLLVAALTAGGTQPELTAAAQVAHVQEQAALAEFRATAPADLRGQYDQTVTGADTAQADRDLAQLLDGGQLTRSDRALGAKPVNAALTARIGLMRTVEASAATDEARAAAHDRDDDVTALELRAALAALCLLLVVGVLVTVFRSLTRPLAALHRWSRADAESGQGAEVTGTDEFAAVARRANALTQEAQALRSRSADLAADRIRALGVHGALSAERDTLLRRQDELTRQLAAATTQGAAQLTYVNLSLRTLGLVERQLTLIEGLEDQEQEPDRLETLFKLDHLATRMRRNSENLLVLTGTEHSHGAAARPVPLVDVARAAISEIERYDRVRIQVLAVARIAGRAADDISHLLAELLDNATSFSAPHAEVHLSGWLLESGEVMLSVEDAGIGVPPERLGELNAVLADPDPAPPGTVSGMGLYVVSRLAHRHGVRVQLRPQKLGGTAAVVVLPRVLLPAAQPDEQPATPVEAALAGEPMPAATTPAGAGADAPSAPEPAAETATAAPEFGRAPAPAADPAVPRQTEHTRPAPDGGTAPGQGASRPRHRRVSAADTPAAPVGGSLTGKGLPQRTPRSTGLTGEPATREPQRGGPVDAEALRRKLGGLQRGLQAGRRDVEEEITSGSGPVAGAGVVIPEQGAGAGPGAVEGTAVTTTDVRGDDQGDAGPAETVEEATR
ncbi:nitrate- and nitrite sensing domain-containing protein [Streptomyces sp. NPDC093221]|uniref:sensor histidine kinase n=1 Tax=Streptomyces sp. NPDC093221 TaxID=3366032 RepID=UPI00382EA699